jgi:hypothetical protein
MVDNLTAHPSAACWSGSPADAGALAESFHLNPIRFITQPSALEHASRSTPGEIMPYPNPPRAEKHLEHRFQTGLHGRPKGAWGVSKTATALVKVL